MLGLKVVQNYTSYANKVTKNVRFINIIVTDELNNNINYITVEFSNYINFIIIECIYIVL